MPATAPRPLSPSGLGGVHVLAGEPTYLLTEDEAKARGTALHRLLEHLHRHPPADRPALAARLLPDNPDLPALLAEATAVLDAPALAFLFAPGTLAEVDIAAPLAALGGGRILGRIDRLVVDPDRVLAVDFKSHQAVPATPEAVPEGILRQMGAYHAALALVWPARRVETAILWTRTARLMPLPAPLVAAALARGLTPPLWPSGPRRPTFPSATGRRHGHPARADSAVRGLHRPRPRAPGALAPRRRRRPRRRGLAGGCVRPPAARRPRRQPRRSGSSSSPTSPASPVSSSAPSPPRAALQRRGPATLIGPGGFRPRDFALGIAAVVLLGALAALTLSGLTPPVRQMSLAAWAAWLPLALPALLVQTAAEEIAFRGYLLQGLAARFRSRWIWWLLPALGFGALHWNPAEFGANAWLVALSTAVIGLILADVTIRTGNLSAAIGLHFANNVASLLVVALPSPLASLSLYLAEIDPADADALRPLLLADLATTLAAYAAWLALCHRRRRLHSEGRGSI